MEKRQKELTEFPFEGFVKVLEYLDTKSILNVRLTCSDLKSFIDEYIGVNITLVERPLCIYTKKQLAFFCGVAVNRVYAKDMLGTDDDNNGKRSYLTKKCFFDDIFRYPEVLRLCTLDGKTHVQFLFDILTKCPNIESLCLYNGFEFEGDLVPLLIKENKKEYFTVQPKDRSDWLCKLSQKEDIFHQITLNRLKIFHFIFQKRPIKNSEFLNLALLLNCIRSKEVTRMQVTVCQMPDFTEMEYFYLSMIFTNFLEAHIESLTDFSFYIDPPDSKPKHSPSDFGAVKRSLFNQHVQLESDKIQGEDGFTVDQKLEMVRILQQRLGSIGKISKLTYLTVRIPPNFHWSFWLLFIENLKNLSFLRLWVSTKYRILKNCEFLKNSSKSLKRLRLNLDIVNDFDFSGIEKCQKLDEMYLFNKPVSSKLITQGPLESHVKNTKLIPAGLKALVLGAVVAGSADLNKMLASQKTLDTLVIMNMPSMNAENGTDCKCLKKIFRMRSLHSCLIQGFRCKSRKTYDRIYQMLDFQMAHEDKAFSEQLDHVMGYSSLLGSAAPLGLDIVSAEIPHRYIWEKHFFPANGYTSHYSLNYNPLDPYL